MFEIFILYGIIGTILLLSLFLFTYPQGNKFRKIHKTLIKKFSKKKLDKFENIFFTLWWLYIISITYRIIYTDNLERLILTILLCFALILLNYFHMGMFRLLAHPSKILRIKISKQKLKRANGIGDKINAYSKPKYSTLFIYSLILLSFSFSYIIMYIHPYFLGLVVLTSILFYLIRSIINIFISQNEFLLIADKLALFNEKIEGEKGKQILAKIAKMAVHFSELIFLLDKDKSKSITKGFDWAINNLRKLEYISKLGVSVFKTYLTLKLIFVIVTSLIFFIIVNGNYYLALSQSNFIHLDIKFFSQAALIAFYNFIGESVDFGISSNYLNYFSFYLLACSILGWIVTVTYIILFFDIISISLADLYESINKAAKKISSELLSYLKELGKNVEELETEIRDMDQKNSEKNKAELFLKAISNVYKKI